MASSDGPPETDQDQGAKAQALGALLQPLAGLMIALGLPLRDGVELLKLALVRAAQEQNPEASASHISLITGVHRKDLKRFEQQRAAPSKQTIAAARVLSLWQNDPDFRKDGAPRDLARAGDLGFDALVKRARVDAAPATLLSVLVAAGTVDHRHDVIRFKSAALIPDGQEEKLQSAVATLVPHLRTAIGNVTGEAPQWDQVLRYSHLSEEAARQLESEAAKLSLELLKKLNKMAFDLQKAEEGEHFFAAGSYTRVEDHSE